jgi:hypothetical protein
MAQRKYQTDSSEQQGASSVASPRESSMSVQSPARVLQRLLDERNSAFPEPHVERWSQRRTVAFLVASASALWLAILVAGAQAARLLA